jgi:hypothetical protein
MTGPDPAPLLLDSERVDELHRLLGTVEDWLLHTCDETLDDLGRFLAGQAWSGGPPERRPALHHRPSCMPYGSEVTRRHLSGSSILDGHRRVPR